MLYIKSKNIMVIYHSIVCSITLGVNVIKQYRANYHNNFNILIQPYCGNLLPFHGNYCVNIVLSHNDRNTMTWQHITMVISFIALASGANVINNTMVNYYDNFESTIYMIKMLWLIAMVF